MESLSGIMGVALLFLSWIPSPTSSVEPQSQRVLIMKEAEAAVDRILGESPYRINEALSFFRFIQYCLNCYFLDA
jgi:hypothetical protein